MQVPAQSHWECQEPQLSAPFPGHAQGCVCKEQPEGQGSLSLKIKSR